MARLTRHGARNPDSTMLILPNDGGREMQADMVHCCHCGKIHAVGASIAGLITQTLELGYCAKCDGIHCATKRCAECTPWESRLETMEHGG